MKGKIILITGATAGFGKAIAYKFAEHGWNIIITGRREERLIEIENDLKRQFDVKVLSLCFDVRNKNEVDNLGKQGIHNGHKGTIYKTKKP